MKKIIATLLISTTLSACGFEIVNTGHRGVKTELGKVTSDSLPEGIYFYNPLTSNVIEMDVRTRSTKIEALSYTKDVQQAKISVVVNYNLAQDSAHLMFKEVGTKWEEILIPQVINGALKTVVGRWDAVELVSNRGEATAQIREAITSELAYKHITVSGVELANIDFASEFEKAVEAKVVAIQRASEAENKTKQVTEEAKQRIISAEAEAKSMRIRSDALSQNASLVQYEAVQKWDGHLPQYMLGNSTPFINVTGAK